MANVDNVETQHEKDENKSKKKRKVRKVRRKRVKKARDDENLEAEDEEAVKEFQQGARFVKRKSSSLSLEVEKMAQGKQLTHFQVRNGLDIDIIDSLFFPLRPWQCWEKHL